MKKHAREVHRGETPSERMARLHKQAGTAPRPKTGWEAGPPDWWLREQHEYQQHLIDSHKLLPGPADARG